MNRVRITGILLMILGIILAFSFENDLTDFLMGLFIGSGVVFLITGRTTPNRTNKITFKKSSIRED